MGKAGGVVDVHSHHLAAALIEALERNEGFPRIRTHGGRRLIDYGRGSGHPVLDSMTDVGLRLRDMDEAGIGLAVVSANLPGVDWLAPADAAVVARDVNDELIALSSAHPERFAALAALPMGAPELAAAELERAVGAGMRGAMVYSNVGGETLDRPECRAVFETAARLDVPVVVHPTYPLGAASVDAYALIPTLGFLYDTTTAVARLILDGLYERTPEAKLFICHAGSLLPQLAGRMDREAAMGPGGTGALTTPPSEQLRLLYTDTVCGWTPALRNALELFGEDRVMHGTDYPFWEPGWTADAISGLGLGPAAQQAIDRENAERLFALGGR